MLNSQSTVCCAVQLVFPNTTTSTSCTHGSRSACVHADLRRVAHSLQLLRWCPRQHNAPRRVLRAAHAWAAGGAAASSSMRVWGTRHDTRHHTTSNEWQVHGERDESSTWATGARTAAHLVTVTQAGTHRPQRIPCAQHRCWPGSSVRPSARAPGTHGARYSTVKESVPQGEESAPTAAVA